MVYVNYMHLGMKKRGMYVLFFSKAKKVNAFIIWTFGMVIGIVFHDVAVWLSKHFAGKWEFPLQITDENRMALENLLFLIAI